MDFAAKSRTPDVHTQKVCFSLFYKQFLINQISTSFLTSQKQKLLRINIDLEF